MNQTRDQKCLTILEVAADWQELKIPQSTMMPQTARISEQLDTWFAPNRLPPPKSATLGLYPKAHNIELISQSHDMCL